MGPDRGRTVAEDWEAPQHFAALNWGSEGLGSLAPNMLPIASSLTGLILRYAFSSMKSCKVVAIFLSQGPRNLQLVHLSHVNFRVIDAILPIASNCN